MKTLLVCCLLACGLRAAGQALPYDSTRHLIVYSGIIAVPGASQAELYGRALKWLAKLPPLPTEPTVRDAGSGTLAARVGVPFVVQVSALKMPFTLWREVSVEVKDGRVKYDLSDFAGQLFAPTPGQLSTPTKAQLRLHPLEEYLDKTKWENYTSGGQPRVIPAGFLAAADTQTRAQLAALRAALTVAGW